MTTSTRDMLYSQLQNVSATIEAYASQIESGRYGRQLYEVAVVNPGEDDEPSFGPYAADDEDDAYTAYRESEGFYLPRSEVDIVAMDEYNADEPTVDDTPIYDYPLEVVDERGRPFAVVIGTGGPHIEVTADGSYSASLVGYWGGVRVELSGSHFDTFLDYFIER